MVYFGDFGADEWNKRGTLFGGGIIWMLFNGGMLSKECFSVEGCFLN